MAFFRTPCYERLDWETTTNAVLECERLGYDSLFVADHVFLGREGAIFEGWTLLSAFAAMTKRVLLAPIHLCDSFRNHLDGNGVLTATELGAFAAPIVSKFSSQTPVFGNLEGSEGGEFVFSLELENLSQMSRALDREAIAVSAELESLQRELTSKLERNLELGKQVEELRSSGPVEIGELSHEERLAQANRHHALGLQYFREERHELALRELEEAVRLNSANPTIVNNYGFVLYRLDRFEASLGWFEKTIALDPGRAVVYLNLADALWKLGREDDARPRYRRYLELWPASPRRAEIEGLIGNVSR
jgi:tetratricopeptide (TPR) repeat protein